MREKLSLSSLHGNRYLLLQCVSAIISSINVSHISCLSFILFMSWNWKMKMKIVMKHKMIYANKSLHIDTTQDHACSYKEPLTKRWVNFYQLVALGWHSMMPEWKGTIRVNHHALTLVSPLKMVIYCKSIGPLHHGHGWALTQLNYQPVCVLNHMNEIK